MPIISYTIRHYWTRSVEAGGSNRRRGCRQSLERSFWILIPKVKSSVTSTSQESTICRMKRDCVDWIYELVVNTMAFEGEFSTALNKILPLIFVVYVFNSHPSLYTSKSISTGVWKAADDSSLPFQRGNVLLISELLYSVNIWGIGQVVDQHMPFCCTNNHQRASGIHRVYSFRHLNSVGWIRLAEIPILHQNIIIPWEFYPKIRSQACCPYSEFQRICNTWLGHHARQLEQFD